MAEQGLAFGMAVFTIGACMAGGALAGPDRRRRPGVHAGRLMRAPVIERTFTVCRFAGLDDGREVYGPWHPIAVYEGMKATAAAWNTVRAMHRVWVERR